VEFNKAAQSLTDAIIPAAQKRVALSRLIKDNIALIAVLEAKFGNHGAENPGKRQLLCVVRELLFLFWCVQRTNLCQNCQMHNTILM